MYDTRDKMAVGHCVYRVDIESFAAEMMRQSVTQGLSQRKRHYIKGLQSLHSESARSWTDKLDERRGAELNIKGMLLPHGA